MNILTLRNGSTIAFGGPETESVTGRFDPSYALMCYDVDLSKCCLSNRGAMQFAVMRGERLWSRKRRLKIKRRDMRRYLRMFPDPLAKGLSRLCAS